MVVMESLENLHLLIKANLCLLHSEDYDSDDVVMHDHSSDDEYNY